MPYRQSRIARAAATAAALLVLQTAASAAPEPAGATGPLLLPTPLVLKDGRLAEVSVHILAFEEGVERIGPEARGTLMRLIRGVSPECVLTAQVIGHVRPDEAKASDTLAAHRLARARADNVQMFLRDQGLPTDGVASVWDWQFMVREPRATLWVFRTRDGDGCADDALGETGPALTTEATPAATESQDEPEDTLAPEQPVVVAARPSTAPRTEPRPLMRADPVGAPVPPAAPSTRETQTADRASDAAAGSEAAEASAEPARTGPKPLVASAAGTPAPPAESAEPDEVVSAAAEQPPQSAAEPIDVESTYPPASTMPPAQTAGAPAETAEVAFAINSSWFESDATTDLEALLAGLREGARYDVRIEATVGRGDVPGTEDDTALRYNRWLADRRAARVKGWLMQKTQGSTVRIAEGRVDNDGSRRVIVHIRPLP